ncbi:STAS-like domain-containing protein [Paraburkholderia caledonica]|uniref:STAS-like domain-containing protein n=1 Tax=Paraburkholderia caledonica TaxID=134536 RepID=UPI0038BDC5B9
MVIRALDIVRHCYSNADGQKIFDAIVDYVRRGERVVVSFDGVDAVPSSFVNSAFIALLDQFPFDRIKQTLSFSKTTPQINEMIRSRFAFESGRRSA